MLLVSKYKDTPVHARSCEDTIIHGSRIFDK